MAERDGVYEAEWEGPAGIYSVCIVVEDANGNLGESEASRLEIPGGPRVVEPGGPDPGLEPALAGDWRPVGVGPGRPLEVPLRQIHPAEGGAWYGRTKWQVWRSSDEGASWQPVPFMLSGREWGHDQEFGFNDMPTTVHGEGEDPRTAYLVEGELLWPPDEGSRESSRPLTGEPHGRCPQSRRAFSRPSSTTISRAGSTPHRRGRSSPPTTGDESGGSFPSKADRWVSGPTRPIREGPMPGWTPLEGWGAASGGSTGPAREPSAQVQVPLPGLASLPFRIPGRPEGSTCTPLSRGTSFTLRMREPPGGCWTWAWASTSREWPPRTPHPAWFTRTATDSWPEVTTAAKPGRGRGPDSLSSTM